METQPTGIRPELLALLARGVEMSDERISKYPAYTALKQIRAQLAQVQADVARGGTPDPDIQRAVIFGRFAVREIQDMDPEYARVLVRAAYLYQEQLARAS